MSAQATHNRVMFVDDEEGVRTSWDRFLSERGFDVTTANDGGAAIERLREEPVDVVVSDLKMPGLDGVALLEWLHEEQPETRFILFTGYGNAEVERRVKELGAFDYLNKPIYPEELAAVVTAATHLKLLGTEDDVAEAASVSVQEAEAVPVETLPEESALRMSGPRRAMEIVGGLIVAPLLGLAFVIFLPVIGFGALFWTLGREIWRWVKPAAT